VNAERAGTGWIRAGFVSRATADLIDAVLICVATATLVVVGSMLRALFGPSPFAFPRLRGIEMAGYLSLAFLAYLTFFWSSTGRTPGKQASGLRVVTASGESMGFGRALGRAILCTVFPFGFLWVAVSARNLALHDVVVRTAVVYDWSARSAQSATASIRSSDGSARGTDRVRDRVEAGPHAPPTHRTADRH
jgi:uncharacterized RDD family membrane protein YckC